MRFKISVALLEEIGLFLLEEDGCVKISVALLRQSLLPYKIRYMRSKISVAWLRHPFSVFFIQIL